ncbi:hypothetical protein BaRGS_00015513, partial [Batillaria attramentaria]
CSGAYGCPRLFPPSAIRIRIVASSPALSDLKLQQTQHVRATASSVRTAAEYTPPRDKSGRPQRSPCCVQDVKTEFDLARAEHTWKVPQ